MSQTLSKFSKVCTLVPVKGPLDSLVVKLLLLVVGIGWVGILTALWKIEEFSHEIESFICYLCIGGICAISSGCGIWLWLLDECV